MVKIFFRSIIALLFMASISHAQSTKTASQLWDEFRGNEIRFEQTYKGKRINLSGEVSEIGTASGGRGSVSLKGGGLSFIVCYFDGKYKGSLAKLDIGQKLSMSGIYRSKLITTLFFEDCGPTR